jgi:hypothetical protein
MPTSGPPSTTGTRRLACVRRRTLRLLDAVRGGHGDEDMTTEVGQGGGRRVPRLGHSPYHDIVVGDHATDLVVLDDHHAAHLGIPHGAGGLEGGGHQHTHRRGHTILLGVGPASWTRRCGAAVRAGPVRRRTALTDMVPHAARRLPVVTLTAAPMLL